MSDTKKINTFSFKPSKDKPLDQVFDHAKKVIIPPKEEYISSVYVTPLRNKVVIEQSGEIYRDIDGKKVKVEDEDVKKLIIEAIKNKEKTGAELGE